MKTGYGKFRQAKKGVIAKKTCDSGQRGFGGAGQRDVGNSPNPVKIFDSTR